MTETQTAAAMLQMIGNDRVRIKIARRVASLYQIQEWEAERDLIRVAEEIAEKIPEQTNASV